jgi:hypothetical protein
MQPPDNLNTRPCRPVKNEIAPKTFHAPDPHALGERTLKGDRLANGWQRHKLDKSCLCCIKKSVGSVQIIRRDKCRNLSSVFKKCS